MIAQLRNYRVDDLTVNLAQEEMQDAIVELDTVIESQEQWYADFNKVLMFNLPPNFRDLSSHSHHLCAFGAWLDVYGNEQIRQLPIFKEITQDHKLLHQLASELLVSMLQHHKPDPVKFGSFFNLEKLLRHRLHELNKQLRDKVSNVDMLTGLYNHKEMIAQLSQQQKLVDRGVYDVSIILIGIDDFQTVNQEWSRVAGDMLLKELSEQLTSVLRAYDNVFRYSGGEFLLLLPDTNLYEAYEILSRMKLDISLLEIQLKNSTVINATTSFGVFQLQKGTDQEFSIRQAQHALNEQKRNLTKHFLNPSIH